MRNYTRWTKRGVSLVADILGAKLPVTALPGDGVVLLGGSSLTPDEARMYGVRLIEAAALADDVRAIRDASS
jgi:hypothetical protein